MNSAPADIATLDEGRQQARTHSFVAAALYAKTGSVPVHVRNMSSGGALVEAAVLPPVDADVVLKRGSLQAAGTIVWSVGRKAGIAFSGAVHVTEWMVRQPAPHQSLVDAIVSEVKVAHGQAKADHSAKDLSGDGSIAAQLQQLRADLAQLESGLVRDVIVVATHPEIQLIDVSLQRIDRLIRQVREG